MARDDAGRKRVRRHEHYTPANALLFLASDEARYVTGTELTIDAGFTLQ